MATETDLILRTAEVLNIASAGQALSAEDRAVIVAVMAGTLEELRARSVVPSFDLTAIPDAIVIPLAQRIAIDVAPAFAVPADGLAAMGVTLAGSEARLRALRPTVATAQTVVFEAF